MKKYLCVCREWKELDYLTADWQVIEAETRNKARYLYCQMLPKVRYQNVLATLCRDSQMEAKLEGWGHPLAVARD